MTLHKSSRVSPEEAAELARRLIEINEDYNSLLRAKETSNHIRSGLLNELLARVEATMSQDLPQPSALNLAGRIAFDLGLTKLATDYFQRASNLDHTNASYLVNLGNAHAATGNYPPAMSMFQRALKLDSANISAFQGIAFCLLGSGEFGKAFLHYRSLLSFGYRNATIHNQIVECLENLSCEHYTEEMELLALYLFKVDDFSPLRLVPFSTELLSHKYDLRNPNAALSIETLVNDELLLNVLETGVIPDTDFEDLITQLRLSILTECVMSGSLRDELIPCVAALGVYANHADYALIVTPEEEQEINALRVQIAAQIGNQKLVIEEIAGALLLLAMYECLYVQSFSFNLLGLDIDEWPIGMQGMLQASLYDLSHEHHAKFELFGHSMNELLENGVTRSSNRWKPRQAPQQANFYTVLSKKLGATSVPRSWSRKELRLLVLACGSGERAHYYATSFNCVTVLGADSSKVDMAYAHAQTSKMDAANLSYAVADYAQPPLDMESFDFIEFGEGFDFEYLNDWMSLLSKDGIAKITLPNRSNYEETQVLRELVSARGLQASLENIRLIRNSILLEKSSQLWEKLFDNPMFYSGSGCRDLMFKSKTAFFDLEKSHRLLDKIGVVPLSQPNLTNKASVVAKSNTAFNPACSNEADKLEFFVSRHF